MASGEMREGYDSRSLNLDRVVLLCPTVDLGELGPHRQTCSENVGFDAWVAATTGVLHVLVGLPRRVAYIDFRHFPASALERAFVHRAKLFPKAEELLKRLRLDTRAGHEKAFVTLAARLRLDVAKICVIAIVAFLLVVRCSRSRGNCFVGAA